MSVGRDYGLNRTKIVNIIVTGYQKIKELQKHQVFAMDVTWNNGEQYEAYRRYSDFFDFQRTLEALFPDSVGSGNYEESIIPQLPIWRSEVSESHVTEADLEQFNCYCQTIISSDPSISESPHVIAFFTPRGGDKQLPTVQLRHSLVKHQSKPKELRVEGRLEQYRALAKFTALGPSQVSFEKGDKVYVKCKDKSGWWRCQVNGKTGWAPPTYLQKCTDDTEAELSEDSLGYIRISTVRAHPVVSQNSNSSARTEPENASHIQETTVKEYKTIETYEADRSGQVTYCEGDHEAIHILDKLEDGSWLVKAGEEEEGGLAPCSNMERWNREDDEEITPSDGTQKYHSVCNYEAEEDDEISFPEGAVIDVMQKRLDGWWVVEYKDRMGLAPSTFLREGLLPVEKEDQSKEEETDHHQVDEPKKEIDLLYENLQIQTMQAQLSRRNSVGHWAAAEKRNKRPNPMPTTPPQDDIASAHDNCYLNCLPNILTPDPKSKMLGALREHNEEETMPQGEVNYQGSVHSALYDKGGMQNNIKASEITTNSETLETALQSEEGLRRQATAKPPIPAPRTRIRNQSYLSLEEKSEASPPHPRIKAEPKLLAETSEVSHTCSPLSRRVRPTNRPLTTNEDSQKEAPQLGPGHEPRPDAHVHLPCLPPRPTLSVYQQAKHDSKLNNRNRGLVSHHITTRWPEPMQQNKPQQRLKKIRRQKPVDKKFQATCLPRPHPKVVKIKGASNTRERPYSTSEAAPQNGVVGGASAGGGNPICKELTGVLLKYILASSDPNLKATLQRLIINNEAIKNSLE